MSKLVNWGHWLVGAFVAILAAVPLWHAIMLIPGLIHQLPDEFTYYFLSGAFFIWMPTLFCAWAIYKWRPWARSLGILLCAFYFAVFALAFSLNAELNRELVLLTLIAGSSSVWLLLPGVREEYSRRNQIA